MGTIIDAESPNSVVGGGGRNREGGGFFEG